MMSRLFWVIALVSASLLQAAQKNVVIFVTDDQGLEAGCYGNKVLQTPNLDRLAAAGTRFSHAFAAVSSCSPSRSAILTGLYNHTNGQYGLAHLPYDFKTHDWVESLPALLRRAGYRTAVMGKFHVQPEQVYPFDVRANPMPNVLDLVAKAEAFLREKADQPFFMYFCTIEPHRANKGFGGDVPRRGLKAVTYDPAKIEIPPFLPKLPVVAEELADYYQAISRADTALGRVLEALKATNHSDDTLIIFISDNGMPFPGAKTNLYDPGIHLPLVIRSPGGKAGVVCDAMASWVDLVPTVLDFTGAKGPKYNLPGRSLLAVLDQEHAAGWDEIYASHTAHEVTMYYPMRTVRTRRYKLLLNIAHELPYPIAGDLYKSRTWQALIDSKADTVGPRTMQAYVHRPEYELYDLQEDPLETHNLANIPEHRATLEELQGKLRAWQEQTEDPWVIKYTHE